MKKIAIIAACLALGVAANASETTPSRAKARASAMAHPMYFRIDAGTDIKTKVTGHYKKNDATTEYVKTKNKSGLVGQIGLGYRFNEMLRGDVTLVHRAKHKFTGTTSAVNDITERQSFTHSAVMLNGYVDIVTFNNLTPYVHAGIGYGQLKAKKIIGTETSTNTVLGSTAGKNSKGVTWSLGAGVAFAMSPLLDLDLGYKFAHLGKIGAKPDADNFVQSGKVSVHEVLLGLRYKF